MSLRIKMARKLVALQLASRPGKTLEEERARLERMARFTRLPRGVRCQPLSVNGVPAEWIEAAGADLGAILYLHGGAYALGSISLFRRKKRGARPARPSPGYRT